MFSDIHQKFGSVDVLVNNAGIQYVSAIDEFPDEKWEQIIATNLSSSFYTIKNSIKSMKIISGAELLILLLYMAK